MSTQDQKLFGSHLYIEHNCLLNRWTWLLFDVPHLERVKGHTNLIMHVGITHTQSYLECHTSWVAQLSVKQPRTLWHNRICNLRKLTHNHKNIRKWTPQAAQQLWKKFFALHQFLHREQLEKVSHQLEVECNTHVDRVTTALLSKCFLHKSGTRSPFCLISNSWTLKSMNHQAICEIHVGLALSGFIHTWYKRHCKTN